MARTVDKEKHEARRRHILGAALACFRRDGFRGASISDICAEAKMSPGHVYHYFPGKEAIVEAIAAEDLRRVGDLFEGVSGADDFVGELLRAGLDQMADGSAYGLDGALGAEIVAEASRNGRIAAILKHFWREAEARIVAALGAAQACGRLHPSLDVEQAALMVVMLAEGFGTRVAADPDFDDERSAAALLTALRRVLMAPEDDRPA